MPVKKKDYWVCIRCKNNSLKTNGTMIPCPRGSCEAEIKGEIIITQELKLFDDEIFKQKSITETKLMSVDEIIAKYPLLTKREIEKLREHERKINLR